MSENIHRNRKGNNDHMSDKFNFIEKNGKVFR